MTATLNQLPQPTATNVDMLAHALAIKTLKLGHVLTSTISSGYSSEAAPLARVMLEAAASAAYLAKNPQCEGKAVSFFVAHIESQLNYLKLSKKRKTSVGSRAEMDVQIAKLQAEKVDVLKISPPYREGRDDKTFEWTGHKGFRELFKKIGLPNWYLDYYGTFSNEVHANVAALLPEIDSLIEGGSILIGPSWQCPLRLFAAAVEAAVVAVAALARIRGVDLDQKLQENIDKMGQVSQRHTC